MFAVHLIFQWFCCFFFLSSHLLCQIFQFSSGISVLVSTKDKNYFILIISVVPVCLSVNAWFLFSMAKINCSDCLDFLIVSVKFRIIQTGFDWKFIICKTQNSRANEISEVNKIDHWFGLNTNNFVIWFHQLM